MNIRFRQFVTVSTLIMTLVVNGLANVLPINNQTTESISDSFPVFFVPAGYVFSIWGLIYLALIGYAVYQLLPSQYGNALHSQIAPYFWANCVANAGWILAWHYNQLLPSVLIMLVILLTLVRIYLILGTGRYVVSSAETYLARFPFSIYLAWITVATIANITTLLYDLDWDGFGLAPNLWAVIMLIVATIVTSIQTIRHHDIPFVGVIVWAFIGIAVKHNANPPILGTAIVMTAIVILMLFVRLPHSNSPAA